MSIATLAASPRTLPPNLDDPNRYTRISGVPVFTTHVRKIVDGDRVRFTSVDADQLKIICENTNNKVRKGEYPLLRIGHINPQAKETDQPPTIGYFSNHQMSTYNGQPAIVADMYVRKDKLELLDQYPRRSAEVFNKELPNGYIDAVAILCRSGELDLGYITNYSKHVGIECFECESCKEDREMADDLDDSEGDSEADDAGPDNEEADDDLDGDDDDSQFDEDTAQNLGNVLGKHTAKHLTGDAEFHAAVGKAVAEVFKNDPTVLDALIARIGNALDKSEKRKTEDHDSGGGVAGTPSGTNTSAPDMERFMADENQDINIRYGLLEAQNAALAGENKELKERITKLETFSKQTQEENRRTKRRLRLKEIADKGVMVKVDDKLQLASTLNLNDEQFEMFAKDIEDNYARSPVDQSAIELSRDGVSANPSPETTDGVLTVQERDGNAVELFCKEQGITIRTPDDGVTAVQRYFREADRSKYGVAKK